MAAELGIAAGAGDHIVRLSRRRRVIGRRLRESVATKPPVTIHTTAPAGMLLASTRDSEPRVTVTGFVGRAAVAALGRHPGLNAHLGEAALTMFGTVHLGIPVDAPAGLIVPVVRDAGALDAGTLTHSIAAMAAKAREGTVTPDEVTDATFTISSLGAFGVGHFTPILDPPQVAVLGVGCIREQVVQVAGAFVVEPVLYLSLTFDHAALDGAPAARYLADLVTELQQPIEGTGARRSSQLKEDITT